MYNFSNMSFKNYFLLYKIKSKFLRDCIYYHYKLNGFDFKGHKLINNGGIKC